MKKKRKRKSKHELRLAHIALATSIINLIISIINLIKDIMK
ncbi:MAG: hypothetical protein SO040_00655 [Catenibacterium mitsuokai]|nr:hypothetical protein [Catenibacterium mitsuokai]MDY3675440.1 hypothetical protein [Catenibacterium mitsuokai]